MAYDPAFAYLIAAGVIVSVLIVISVFCVPDKKKKRRGNEDEGGEAVAGARPRPRVNNVPPGGRARRRPVRRNRMQMGEDDSGEEDMPGRGPPGDEEEEEGMFDDFDQPEGKIGAKKLRKLEEKAEKKRMREMELQEREEKKEREKKLEAQRKREEERRKAEEELQEEQDKLRKEEEEQREHEEYLKMKEMFSVDEEGEDENAANLDSPSLLQEFINYIKEMKVVMLEDLAAHFKLKTQDCIDRIQDLQADGKLTGVVDDRGKFIYITMEELDSVAKYIRQLGRVSISELAESSNRLINLNPDNADVHKKLVVGDNTEVIEVTS